MHVRFGNFTWGYIGISYENMFGCVIAHIVVTLIAIFAIIGLIATIKFIARKIQARKNSKESAGDYWRRTGRLKEEPTTKKD